tara:strand:- start:67 stop:753 length:687 start_codon:yes stop_codon:yes gene_type:complete
MINRKEVVNYVRNSKNESFQQRYGQLDVIFKDKFVNDIDDESVFIKAQSMIPRHIFYLIDAVYIGDFDFFKEKKINASYMDGTLYISNVQDDEDDMLDDIIHEIAHACEEKYGSFLYQDGEIEMEFFKKRKKLKSLLNSLGIDSNLDFANLEYNEAFDKFLHEEIGYEKLSILTNDIFINPYAITSLREYFASGFEAFYLGETSFLKTLSPYIYKKVYALHAGEADEY